MSTLNIPEDLYVQSIGDSGNSQFLGEYTVAEAGSFTHGKLRVYLHGPVPSTVKLQLKVYSDKDKNDLIITSDLSSLSDIEGYVGSWRGDLRFDFNGYPLNPTFKYYVYIDTVGYTLSPSAYISTVCDYPLRVNTDAGDGLAARFEFFTSRF